MTTTTTRDGRNLVTPAHEPVPQATVHLTYNVATGVGVLDVLHGTIYLTDDARPYAFFGFGHEIDPPKDTSAWIEPSEAIDVATMILRAFVSPWLTVEGAVHMGNSDHAIFTSISSGPWDAGDQIARDARDEIIRLPYRVYLTIHGDGPTSEDDVLPLMDMWSDLATFVYEHTTRQT